MIFIGGFTIAPPLLANCKKKKRNADYCLASCSVQKRRAKWPI